MAPEFWSCPQFAFPGATIKSRAREEAEKYTRTGFLPGTEHFVGAVQNSEGRRTCTRCGDAAEWQHASKGDTIHTAPAIVTIATYQMLCPHFASPCNLDGLILADSNWEHLGDQFRWWRCADQPAIFWHP